jgi:hypothetical protein
MTSGDIPPWGEGYFLIYTPLRFGLIDLYVQDTYDLGQYACHSFMASAQFFSFSRKFELRREDSCAQVPVLKIVQK